MTLLKRALVALMLLALVPAVSAPTAHAQMDAGHGKKPRGIALTPMYALTTHEGRKLEPADLKGQPFAVFFGFTSCPDICPTTMLEMGQHLDALGPDAKRIKVFFVSIDPERDTAEKLKAFLSSFDARITGLTGAPMDVATAAHAFGAYYEKAPSKTPGDYSIDHTLNVYLMDRYGLLAATLRAGGDVKQQRETLKKLLAQ